MTADGSAEGTTLRVGVLGATGAVGQRLIEHLDGHPWFELTRVMASDRSTGLTYGEACDWRLAGPMPEHAASIPVTAADPVRDLDVVFSAVAADIALDLEPRWAAAGVAVFSNARSHRMDPDVPLLIPEINSDHLGMVTAQRSARGYPENGCIVTNANCSTTFLAMALAPVHRAFQVRRATVATLQAVSGAGYSGVSSMSILGNVIPFIANEEPKIESEPQKILGTLEGAEVRPAPIAISAQVHRVPVMDGHTLAVSFETGTPATVHEVRAELESFQGEPQHLGLPSAPRRPLVYLEGTDRPQPALDLSVEDGMATLIGRLRPCPVLGFRMVVLGHNTRRGAGPGSVLNAELARVRGLIRRRG